MARAMQGMVETLRDMKSDQRPGLMDFKELRQRIGFDDYYEESSAYDSVRRDG